METEPIDREIIGLTGKRKPRALFVPTASSDSARYVRHFERVYGEHYGFEYHQAVQRKLPEGQDYLPVEALYGTARC